MVHFTGRQKPGRRITRSGSDQPTRSHHSGCRPGEPRRPRFPLRQRGRHILVDQSKVIQDRSFRWPGRRLFLQNDVNTGKLDHLQWAVRNPRATHHLGPELLVDLYIADEQMDMTERHANAVERRQLRGRDARDERREDESSGHKTSRAHRVHFFTACASAIACAQWSATTR